MNAIEQYFTVVPRFIMRYKVVHNFGVLDEIRKCGQNEIASFSAFFSRSFFNLLIFVVVSVLIIHIFH